MSAGKLPWHQIKSIDSMPQEAVLEELAYHKVVEVAAKTATRVIRGA